MKQTILAIDVGNTNIVLGLFSGDKLLFTDRLSTRHPWGNIDLTRALETILRRHSIDPHLLEGAVLSSVVSDLNPLIKQAVMDLSGRETYEVHPGSPCGIDTSSYDTGTLGMDRICDLAAAMKFYGNPVAVFDLGTATTLTLVDEKGVLAGGMISPGIGLSLEALSEHTASLPRLDPKPVSDLLGHDTKSNMLSGTVAACGIRIEAVTDRLRERTGLSDLKTVITGGLGKLVLPWIRTDVIYDPDLLLKGLLILYQMKGENSKLCCKARISFSV